MSGNDTRLTVGFERPTVVRDLEPDDEAATLALFDECRDWFEYATGQPSGPGDVQGLYYALPEGCDVSQKRLLVAEVDGRIGALVDVVLSYPADDECTVGGFLVAPAYRRSRLGTALAEALCEEAARRGIRRVHTTVTTGWHPRIQFLRHLGFAIDTAAVEQGGNRNTGPRERPVHRAVLDLGRRTGSQPPPGHPAGSSE